MLRFSIAKLMCLRAWPLDLVEFCRTPVVKSCGIRERERLMSRE